MPWGRRCELGCEDWPDTVAFARCPICDEATKRWNNLDPIDPDEAKEALNNQNFQRYYEMYCAERGVSVDGPLPEAESAS